MYKVLVVENNPSILKLISYHLEAECCKVLEAVDGLAALMIIDKEKPDIIFTDIIMPKVSGDQLCNIIRSSSSLQDIFIAIHSSTTLEDSQKIMDLEADVYIAKGPATNLKEHVHHVLKQYEKGIRRDKKIIGSDFLYPREITKELLLIRKHYQAIFNNVAEAVVELDSDGKIIQANKAAQRLFGKNPHTLLSSQILDYLTGPESEQIEKWITNISITKSYNYSSSYSTPLKVNGRKIFLNLVAIEEAEIFIIGILQDITVQKNTEEKLAKTIGEFNAVIDTIDYGVLFMDSDLRVRIINQAYQEMWKIPPSFTNIGPTMKELMEYNRNTGIYNTTPDNFDNFVNKRVKAVRKGAIGPMEITRGDGKIFLFQCVVLPDNGRLLTYYDISSLKHTEKKLEEALDTVSNLANHDPLTGLPNLRLARERLLSAISISKRKGWKAAIMFIDLDGFKDINDSHGHEIGDKVLEKVAARLTKSLRESDTVARIGGDEFLVIQTEVAHRFAAANVAEKMVSQGGMR